MVAVYSYKSAQMFKPSGLFGRVVQDATVYFLAIVWVHLTVTIYTSLMGDVSPIPCFSSPRIDRVNLFSVSYPPTIPRYVSSLNPSHKLVPVNPPYLDSTNTYVHQFRVEVSNLSSSHSIIPVMICRLVLSLRKATDPSVVRAWNVDHFSTQIESQTNVYRGSDGVFMTPIHFRHPAATATSSGRGVVSEESGLITPGFRGSLAERGWSIDAPEENEPQDTIVRTL